MAQEYLPAPSNIRLADLMKEHNISQPELAKEIGCSKSTISRFISGAKGTLTHEQVLKIARLFNVSTDFLLGETNIPDRKNYDIAELGLSVEAARNLYTGRINAEVVNLLLENARFAELTYRIAQYFDDTFASGIAAQNAMLTTLSTLLRTKVKTSIGKVANDLFRSMNLAQADLNLDTDDLKQAGNLGLWKAVPKFDAARGMKFLTYAAPAIRNAMMDMVRDAFTAFEQRMVTEDKDGVCYQRVSLDDVLPGEEQLRRIEAIADPYAMQPQSIMEEQESRRELYDGLKRLTQREQTYLLYRYGFTDGEEHPLIGTAIYFHLTKGRAKKTEEQAMDNLWLELPWWFL